MGGLAGMLVAPTVDTRNLAEISVNLLKPSGYFTYRQVLTFKNSTWYSN